MFLDIANLAESLSLEYFSPDYENFSILLSRMQFLQYLSQKPRNENLTVAIRLLSGVQRNLQCFFYSFGNLLKNLIGLKQILLISFYSKKV